jgi:hypothetical protein
LGFFYFNPKAAVAGSGGADETLAGLTDHFGTIGGMFRRHNCGQHANYLWIESKGLTGDNFSETLDKVFSETLLFNNPRPISLCGKS